MFFPWDILENLVLVEVNKNPKTEKHEVPSFGEFIHWIGIWVLCLLSLVSGALIYGAVSKLRPSGERHIASMAVYI